MVPSWFKSYMFFFMLAAFVVISSLLLIPDILTSGKNEVRAIVAAFIFGSLVGLSEIASRYRDEPLKASGSPYGLIYLFLNGYLSMLAFLIIRKFPDSFGALSKNMFAATILAGFGSSVVMRARIAVVKTPDGKEESIGPDYVFKIILRTVDQQIDRWRAARRQRIVSTHRAQLAAFGDFQTAWKYLFASLLAFQNLDDVQKSALNDTYNDYQAQKDVPDAIKQLALGFIFLTLVGEVHFSTVLGNASQFVPQLNSPPTPRPPPESGPTTSANPPGSSSGS